MSEAIDRWDSSIKYHIQVHLYDDTDGSRPVGWNGLTKRELFECLDKCLLS